MGSLDISVASSLLSWPVLRNTIPQNSNVSDTRAGQSRNMWRLSSLSLPQYLDLHESLSMKPMCLQCALNLQVRLSPDVGFDHEKVHSNWRGLGTIALTMVLSCVTLLQLSPGIVVLSCLQVTVSLHQLTFVSPSEPWHPGWGYFIVFVQVFQCLHSFPE